MDILLFLCCFFSNFEPDQTASGKLFFCASLQEMEFGWKLIVGSIVGFFGAALGSVGGVGGGGIFVPMLTVIIGFDPKSSTAISKCKYFYINYTSFSILTCKYIFVK